MADIIKKEFKFSDQVIGQVRELLQLAMLTGTNFVDHMRSMRMEESEKVEGGLILSEAYVAGWNEMAIGYHTEAALKAEQMSSTLADDAPPAAEEEVVESDHEVVISRDPETGKLVGSRQKIQN